MNEQAQAAVDASPLSSEGFEDLLLRASLNFRFVTALQARRERTFAGCHSAPIGETAGFVWQVLSQRGPATFTALIDEIGVTESLFYMAVGWLAREGKIDFENRDGDYAIRLL
jgi:hypothetical protein